MGLDSHVLFNNKYLMNKMWSMCRKLFLLTLVAIGYISCREDDNYIPQVSAYAFYETDKNRGIRNPDVEAKVFFYYRKCLDDFNDYVYLNDGVFIKESYPPIEPDLNYTITENGSISFIPEYMDENATIVIESNYYKGSIGMACFSSIRESVGYYKVFKPEIED